MFVSWKLNRSGSYSVLILEKDGRTNNSRTVRIAKTTYQLNYQLPRIDWQKSLILQMDSEQQGLYDIVMRKSDKL